MDRLDVLDRLARVPFLRRLPPSRLDRLVSESELRVLEPREVLVAEGEPADRVNLVLEGEALVSKRVGAHEEVTIAVRGPGDWLGEMALIDEGPRSATVTAQQRLAVLEIPPRAFAEAIGSTPEAALDLLRVVTARLRESDQAVIAALSAKAEALADENRRLLRDNRRLASELDASSGFESFVGESVAARRVRELARRAAASPLPVLLLGETGTGKEILARAIHAASDRARRAFVSINCALLGEALLESELFGHARGAFTGATSSKPGLVEVADGGTLFLDEIGDMPRSLQGALLRFLERGESRRVGDTRVRHSDVRVIAATHHDLDAAVETGAFRRDLLYRLDVLRIEIPPLRARRDDLPLLLEKLSQRIARKAGRSPLVFTPAALDALAAHDFPGNVRELENELQRLYAVLGPDEREVPPERLSRRIRESDPMAQGRYGDALRAFKIQLLERALQDCGGNQAAAARRLGVHRSNLARMMRELGMRRAGASRGGGA
ncbi:MAG TPA: sigma 54-interacting transcriptional regulator [Myxococcota bacterium]